MINRIWKTLMSLVKKTTIVEIFLDLFGGSISICLKKLLKKTNKLPFKSANESSVDSYSINTSNE